MTKDPAFCTPDTDLRIVAQLMCQRDCGEIPVVDSPTLKRVVGVITDRDITCRTIAQGKDALKLKAKDAMSGDVVTARIDSELQECIRLLEERKIRRLPVVDGSGMLCGIIAQADLARKAPERQAAEVLREVSQPVRH